MQLDSPKIGWAVLPDPPLTIDVTVWQFRTPPLKWPTGLWWFDAPVAARPVRFRAVIVPFKPKLDQPRRVRVDLVYPLDATGGANTSRNRLILHKVLVPRIRVMLPDCVVAEWAAERIDMEYRDGGS